MRFWQNLWSGSTKLVLQECPRCKTHDSKLPPKQRIVSVLMSNYAHTSVHSHQEHEAKNTEQLQLSRSKHIKLRCQTCGYKWEEYHYQ